MKPLTLALTALLALVSIHAAPGEEASVHWMMSYYRDPTPERFVAEVRSMMKTGLLKDEDAQPPVAAFLSQVMADNPAKVPKWLEELSNLNEQQRTLLWTAAWYSRTEEARAFFKKQGLQAYLDHEAPRILGMEVNNPAALDMLWGCFYATGDEEPIRRIISAFDLSKHAGALERYKSSKKSEQDKKEASLDATFQAARWSLESNCRQHPVALGHCETILKDPKLPKDQHLWLILVLSKVAPEKYKIKFGRKKPG